MKIFDLINIINSSQKTFIWLGDSLLFSGNFKSCLNKYGDYSIKEYDKILGNLIIIIK
jgi:hypothetical protein